MGNEHLARLAAARAVAFYVDPDGAVMFLEADGALHGYGV